MSIFSICTLHITFNKANVFRRAFYPITVFQNSSAQLQDRSMMSVFLPALPLCQTNLLFAHVHTYLHVYGVIYKYKYKYIHWYIIIIIITKDFAHISRTGLRNESEFTYGCLSHPDLGPESGCCDFFESIDCRADSSNSSNSSSCYCDDACHIFDDCCDDILEIGCIGKTYNMYFVHSCLQVCLC